VIAGSVDLIKWKFDRLRDELAGAGPARVTQRIEEELNRLSDLGLGQLEPVRRRLMIRQVAQAARVDEASVMASIKTGRGRTRGLHSQLETKPVRPWHPNPREQLLGCLLHEATLWSLMNSEQRELTSTTRFVDEITQQVADAMHSSVENGTGTGLHAVLDELTRQGEESGIETLEAQQRATALMQFVSQVCEDSDERVRRLFHECVGAVSVRDARQRGVAGDVDDSGESEASRIARFVEAQRKMREQTGRGGRNRLSGQ